MSRLKRQRRRTTSNGKWHQRNAPWIITLTLLLLLAAFADSNRRADAQGPERTLIVSGDDNYPPYEFLADGEPTGFNIDLIRAVAEVTDLDIQIELQSWHEARNALERGEIDALAGMYYSESRDERVDFTIPHTHVSPGLFVRDTASIRSLDDALSGAILVQQDDAMHDYLRAQGGSVDIMPVTDPIDALRLLSTGWHDAALLSSKIQGQYLIEQSNLENLRALSVDIEPQQYCFAVQQGDEELAQLLTEGLNSLEATGRYREIYDRWFGVYERQEAWENTRPFIWYGGVLMLILVGALAWTWYLNREVKRRTQSLQDEIDRRREIEENLRLSEEKFRSIVKRSPLGIGVVDKTGQITDCNQALIEILGYTRDELLGMNFEELTHPDDLEEEKIRVLSLLSGEISHYRMVKRYIHKDGHIIWADLSASLLQDDSGEREKGFAFVQEITERRKMEEALKQRNRELLLLQNASQTLSATLNLEQVFQTVLQTMRELLDVTACSLWLVDADTGEIVCREATGGGRDIVLGWRLAPGEGLVGWVTAHAESAIVNDATQDARHFVGVDQRSGLTIRSIISVPLVLKNRTLGVIQAIDTMPGRFEETDLSLLESFATSATIAIENARLYKKAQQEIAAREQAEEALRSHRDHLEEEVKKRTARLRTLVDAMTGREVRMAELKTVIRQLRRQIEAAGMDPIADDPLLGDE